MGSANVPPLTIRPYARCIYEPSRQVRGEAGVPTSKLNSHYHVIDGRAVLCLGGLT